MRKQNTFDRSIRFHEKYENNKTQGNNRLTKEFYEEF